MNQSKHLISPLQSLGRWKWAKNSLNHLELFVFKKEKKINNKIQKNKKEENRAKLSKLYDRVDKANGHRRRVDR